MRRARGLLLGGLVLLVATTASADTLKRKNGQTLKGKVEKYANGEFYIRLESGDRMIIAADNVESVEFDSGGFAVTPPGAPAPGEKVVTLDSSQEVVATGIHLRKGDRVRITASGQMTFADGRTSGPAGRSEIESWPFPGTPLGMLVAMVGSPTSPTYEPIGEYKEFNAPSDGELYLQINVRSLAGAKGAYTARIAQLTTTAPSSVPAGGTSPPVVSQPERRTQRYELTVPSEKAWTDTGIDLYEGDTLRITAEGTINYTTSKTCGPDGGKREWGDLLKALPVNDVGRGALVGLIGESGVARAFLVGSKLDATVPAKGRLFLGINDDNLDNNKGSFKVRVEIVPARR
ncbi:MAG TPA: hypothetical protein VNN18_00095 [Candidatus Xenobia bacterium]|nr:hypothetical protein [Candidatus Xenobia bacterium]